MKRCFVYGQKICSGWESVHYSWTRINVQNFYRKGRTGHPAVGAVSRLTYPCSLFAGQGCKNCEKKGGWTFGCVFSPGFHTLPRLACVENPFSAFCKENLLTCEGVKKTTFYHFRREYAFRAEAVPYIRHYRHRHYGRKSLFGSYRRATGTQYDFLDEEIIRFSNVRQKQSLIESGMRTWDYKRAKRGTSWKNNRKVKRQWMRHLPH